jgi:hypothetical protein
MMGERHAPRYDSARGPCCFRSLDRGRQTEEPENAAVMSCCYEARHLRRVRATFEPSNLRAMSLRYHAGMVSGRAAFATSPSVLRPSRWPISPSLARSASESLSRPFNWPFRIRFSAARNSFRSSSSWSTVPMMKARMRAHSIRSPVGPLIRDGRHRSPQKTVADDTTRGYAGIG